MEDTEKDPAEMEKRKTTPKKGKVTFKKRFTVVVLNLLAMAAVFTSRILFKKSLPFIFARPYSWEF